MEELDRLAKDPRRAKHKTPGVSAITGHKQAKKNLYVLEPNGDESTKDPECLPARLGE